MEMINEWNSRKSISSLCNEWKKERPQFPKQNLLFLLYNVEGLNTHVADVDLLLSNYQPHICILTGVGAAIRKQIKFPNYHAISQPGTNSFGGVIILYQFHIECKVVEKDLNFLMIKLTSNHDDIHIGAIYVPPNSLPPFQLLSKYQNKSFYIFGDFNAKHINWGCKMNNTSGVHLLNWFESTGNEIIAPTKPTSKRSDAIIDFGITHDAKGWNTEVLTEGTSDHFPILFQSPIGKIEDAYFTKTNWKLFKFFLLLVHEYWMSLIYNLDEQTFFSLFSSFLSSLRDKCSIYENATKYRAPWPPELVLLARSVNKAKRSYRRNKTDTKLQYYLSLKEIFIDQRTKFLYEKREQKVKWIAHGHNLWKFAKPSFHVYSPQFKGIKNGSEIITENTKIVEILANYFEKHFHEPEYDKSNSEHLLAIERFNQIEYTPNMPLEPITMNEVQLEWKKFKPKKSSDSVGTSAFILKQLPEQYLGIITVLFNKCATKGNFFEESKHAKVICLSKDGLYPTENKLRPISLLPNIGKWYERIIHKRILKWCHEQNIYVDEQSGFTAERRLQTRIISLIEDIRLTITACNRPALCIFVDFLSAFDNMWFPALISTLYKLEMPLSYIKWIASWLQNRTLAIHYGDTISRTINMKVGAPQGSILAATLFRLHVHFLPSAFFQLTTHLFADDLAILITGSLEKKFSLNIIELEERAKHAMNILKKFSENNLLPVNINKTKALLSHNIVAPKMPKIEFKNKKIEFVNSFRYLGVTITQKLGWGSYIDNKLRKIRNTYNAMKILFLNIPKKETSLRRKIFLAFSLPHFIWLITTWFFFSENQKQKINKTYIAGLRIVYGVYGWNEFTTLILCQEKTLLDYIFSYWSKFSLHLDKSLEATSYQHTWTAFQTLNKLDKSQYKNLGFRKNSKFLKRLVERVKHSKDDWLQFRVNHIPQHEVFKKSTYYLNMFIYKYFLLKPP
ncbi:unnamed protein product [Rotaria socialis]